MRVCGIVCEYNPFHNGHAYHIQKAREITQCDLLICVMSGNVVQRGEMAISDKWTRARIAVQQGCDLVVELPFPFVVQRADRFAYGALRVLKEAGIHCLVFGSECNDIHLLQELANKEFSYKQKPQQGISSAKALEHVFEQKISSNDMLGIFYIKELKDTSIVPYCIQRTNRYHEQHLQANIASATAIRLAHKDGKDISNVSVMTSDQLHGYAMEHYYPFLQTFLMNASVDYLSSLFLMDEGIESLLKKQAQKHFDYASFLAACTSKRYTTSSIQRTLIHALTQTTKEEIDKLSTPSYLRILAYNTNGQKHLRFLQDEGKQIASTFTKIPKEYRNLEYRATTAYALAYSLEERKKILDRELRHAEVIV